MSGAIGWSVGRFVRAGFSKIPTKGREVTIPCAIVSFLISFKTQPKTRKKHVLVHIKDNKKGMILL